MNAAANPKRLFVILGMARSGTSVVSRSLQALGIELGDKLTPGSKWNPKGFFEDNEIVYQINEKLLSAFNLTWDSTKLIVASEFEDNKTCQMLKQKALTIINNRFAQTNYWAFKDPRTAQFLAFWQSVFAEAKVQEQYIIVLRNPLAAAQSFQRLTGADLEHGFILWLLNLLSAVSGTLQKQVLLVSYDALMLDPKKQLARIQNNLQLDTNFNHQSIDTFIHDFLDKKLQHFDYSLADLKAHPATKISPLCVEMYTWLQQVAQDELSFNDPRFQSAWHQIEQQLIAFMPMYEYINTLLMRSAQTQKYIRKLHKSRLWKLIYPLRILDETLRTYRQRNRHATI